MVVHKGLALQIRLAAINRLVPELRSFSIIKIDSTSAFGRATPHFANIGVAHYVPKKENCLKILMLVKDIGGINPLQRSSWVPFDKLNEPDSQRSKPSSRSVLIGEHPHPSGLMQPEDTKSRHRGSKPRGRYELLHATTLLPLG